MKIQLSPAQLEAIAIAAQLARTTWSICATETSCGLDAVQTAFHQTLEHAFSEGEGNDIATVVFGGDTGTGSTKHGLKQIAQRVLAERAAAFCRVEALLAERAINGYA